MKYNRYLICAVCSLILAGCNDDTGNKQCGTETCTDRQVCEQDHCVYVSCDANEKLCPDKQCYDLDTDHDHCGQCDNPCGEFQSCQSGSCELDESKCVSPRMICGDQCIDPNTEHDFCGNCETKCKTDQFCEGGQCHCEGSKTACTDGCFDLDKDTKNCHDCGHDCNAGLSEEEAHYVCVGGQCVADCPAGELICGGNCVNPQTNRDYCNASDDCKGQNAGKVCPVGADCKGGNCICNETGDVFCKIDGVMKCANPKSDAYCGCDSESSGLFCSDLAGVSQGHCTNEAKCEYTCEENKQDCNEEAADGCESDLTTPETCGSCTHVCDQTNTTSVACEAGICKPVCTSESALCGESCVLLNEDNDNCGWCGHKCLGDATCQNGSCVVDSECNDHFLNIEIMDANDELKPLKAYCIQSKEDLISIRDHINSNHTPYPSQTDNPDNAYILTNHIMFENNEKWTPIGTGNGFKDGYFIGNGKRLSGGLVNTGLFDVLENVVIDGLDLDFTLRFSQNDGVISQYAGLLASEVKGNSVIRHVKSNGVIQCYASPCGGLVGKDSGGSNVYSMIDIKGSIETEEKTVGEQTHHYSQHIGGLLGEAFPKKIENVTVNANIVENANNAYMQGLLIGNLSQGDLNCKTKDERLISDCHVKGSIGYKEGFQQDDYTFKYIGGLIGSLSSCMTVQSCSADVQNTVKAESTGGLFGTVQLPYNKFPEIEIVNSVSRGSIDCKNECGGFVGHVGNILAYETSKFYIVLKNDISYVDISQSEDNVASGNFGGFVGTAYPITFFDHCESHGKVDVLYGATGGFAGLGYQSKLESCFADVSVTKKEYQSTSFIGGLIGFNMGMNVSHSIANGDVKSLDTNAACGGLVGYSGGGVIDNCISYSNVECNKASGNFIGLMTIGTISNSMAFGNAVAGSEKSDAGFIALQGLADNTIKIENVLNFGDISAYNAGGLIGTMSNAVFDITGFINGGKITGTNAGYLAGQIELDISGNTINPDDFILGNIFYWKDGIENGQVFGKLTPDTLELDISKTHGFSYNDNKEAILDDDSKLIDSLNDDWVETACELKSGVGLDNPGTYLIPVLQLLDMDICKQE